MVTPESLYAGFIVKNQVRWVKGFSKRELTKKLTVKVHKISKAAKEAIEAKGGSVEIIVKTFADVAENNK